MSGYVPKLISERQPVGPWTRCLESSVCMLTDKLSLGSRILNPRKLAAAIPGSANGTNVAENIAAIADVYPDYPTEQIRASRNTDTIESLLIAGYGFAIVGNYHAIPAHFQRWDPAFATHNPAGHATYIQIDGPKGRKWDSHTGKYVWWMDPLATLGYPGEWMELAVMFGFLNGSTNAYGLEGSVPGSGGGLPIPVPVPETMKYNFSPLPGPSGTFVTGADPLISYINLETGATTRAPNVTYSIAHPIKLDTPIPGTGDRQTAYLVGPASVAVAVLATDGKFTPNQGVDCTAAIAADRAKARIVYG